MRQAAIVWPWILATGCGAAFSSSAIRTAAAGEEMVYACAMEQLKEMGYETLSHDDRGYRVVARRENPNLRRSDPTFRKGLDQLTVEANRTEGNSTALHVTARSLLEYFNRRGQTFQEVKASPEAQEAADTLLDHCAPPGGTAKPPS